MPRSAFTRKQKLLALVQSSLLVVGKCSFDLEASMLTDNECKQDRQTMGWRDTSPAWRLSFPVMQRLLSFRRVREAIALTWAMEKAAY